MMQTSDPDAALAWLDPQISLAGIEGVVAKFDEPYPKPDTRRWRKVRRVSTMEFAVRGFIPEAHGAMRLVLATPDREARLVGTSYAISGRDLKPLADFIEQSRPSERRVWAPFEDGRHDWYELPPAVQLIAEVEQSSR